LTFNTGRAGAAYDPQNATALPVGNLFWSGRTIAWNVIVERDNFDAVVDAAVLAAGEVERLEQVATDHIATHTSTVDAITKAVGEHFQSP